MSESIQVLAEAGVVIQVGVFVLLGLLIWTAGRVAVAVIRAFVGESVSDVLLAAARVREAEAAAERRKRAGR